MEQQSLGKLGNFRRAEIELSVVADDNVLDQRAQLRREIWKRAQLGGNDSQADDHVPKQLALGSIGESTIVTQLVNLSDIVQDRPGNQQIAIDERIMRCYQPGKAAQRENMFQQTA